VNAFEIFGWLYQNKATAGFSRSMTMHFNVGGGAMASLNDIRLSLGVIKFK
jgi:hypothetical protein